MSPSSRRLRWALLIALALHLLLAWRYSPQLFARFESARQSAAVKPPAPADQDFIEISPPPAPPPKGSGLALISTLGGGSPEALQPELPKDFFAKPQGLSASALQLADDLEFARAAGAAIVANIIPAAVRLPNINTLSDKARTPRPKAAEKPRPVVAPPLKAPAPVSVAIEPPPLSAPQVPFLLAPPADDFDVDAAIARAADSAERSARAANEAAASKPAPDYRSLLPQGPLVASPPLPLGGAAPVSDGGDKSSDSGITTFALDAPAAPDNRRAAPDQGKTVPAARQQFFSLLTARLKASNQRQLAEAVKAGPRTTVRMKFLIDRDGSVLSISPAEPISRELAERAAAVIRATPLPPVPDSMAQVPVELTFPVEVYR